MNTLATYGRSMVSVCCGLFSARWVLEALGEQDFGLYGVVGGIIFFVTFINATLTGCVARFYAYSIGGGKTKDGSAAWDDLNCWFNTALSVHIVLPIVLLAIGYPIGRYAIDHWLTIPSDRMDACICVFHISLVTAFVSMVSAPYIAMYTAYQLITELALFGMLQVVALFGCSYALLYVSGDRLIWYAGMMMIVSVSIMGMQMFRSRWHFDVCEIKVRRMFDRVRLRELFSYTGWQIIGGLGFVWRNEGTACLVNVLLGPKFNASYSVGNQLAIHAATLSYAMNNAISPAMTSEEGAGNREQMNVLALRSCKFGSFLVLFFGLPMIVEVDNVLTLWLKTPPEGAAQLCVAMVVVFLLRQLTMGYMMAIHAHGKIGAWQTYDAIGMMLVLPFAYCFVKWTGSFVGIGCGFILAEIFCCLGKVYFAHKLTGIASLEFILGILPRFLVLSGLVLAVSYMFRSCFEPTLWRLCGTSAVSGILTLIFGWICVFSNEERKWVWACVVKRFKPHMPYR